MCDVTDDVPWGNAVRQRLLRHAQTDAVLFMDDDDFYVDGALDTVREKYAETPGRLHIFRLHYIENDFELWEDEELRVGNVAAQMICVPSPVHYPLGCWGDRYEGDFDFIHSTCSLLGAPVWHPEVIALVHHPLLKGTQINPKTYADAHHS